MKYEYVQDGLVNYVRLTGVVQSEIAEQIFTYQDIPGFLPLEIRRVNGEKEYWYDVSGQISLADYLREGKLTASTSKKILLQLFEISMRLQEYLLDSNGVVCHEDYLYVNPGTLIVSGIYQPSIPYHGIKALGRLLECLIDEMDAKEEKLAFFLYELHRQSKIQGMTFYQFRKVLQETIVDAVDTRAEKEKEEVDSLLPIVHQQETNTKEIPILSGMMLVVGIVIVLVLWKMGTFYRPLSGEIDWRMGVGASAFFIGVSAYGAWRVWPGQTKGDKGEKKQMKSICLIPCHGKDPMITIEHFPFLLGQEKERVDGYIPAPGISRIHAQIVQEGEDVLLFDEESSNGTFCNDERMIPWQKKKLRDGDMIRLAQTEYVVEIT